MVSLVKNFILDERRVDWYLHFRYVRNMIPYLYPSGHNLYAKCANVDLQDMTWPHSHTEDHEHKRFLGSFFTINFSK